VQKESLFKQLSEDERCVPPASPKGVAGSQEAAMLD